MGDAADMILDGLCCESCGEIIDGEESGYPRKCSSCGGVSENVEDDEVEKQREKEERRTKRQSNQDWSTKELKRCGFKVQAFNNGVHLRVEGDIDFWPSTGLWITKDKKRERGVKNLISFLQNRSGK